MAQWIEHHPENQRVTGLIPSQGMCLDCGPDPSWGACVRQPHIDVSLSPSLPHSLKTNKQINKILKNMYIDTELVLPIYNVHPYFSLKSSGKKVHIIPGKIWYLRKWKEQMNVGKIVFFIFM